MGLETIRIILAVLGLTSAGTPLAAAATSVPRPNVLFIITKPSISGAITVTPPLAANS